MPNPKQIAEAIAQHEATYHTRPTKANRGKVRPYSKEYEAFWVKYPKRYIVRSNSWVKKGKFDAWQAWQNLAKEEQGLALELVGNEKAGQAVPDAHRWLKGRRWEDYVAKPPFEPLDVPQPNMKMVEKEPDFNAARNKQRRSLGVSK